MNTRQWRRWVLALSGVTVLVASFALFQWNVHYPRPDALGALSALGLGLAIVSGGFALATDPDS